MTDQLGDNDAEEDVVYKAFYHYQNDAMGLIPIYEIANELTRTETILVNTEDETIPGGVLQIIDKEGNVVDSWSTTDEWHITWGLTEGEEYTIHQVSTPYPYRVAEDDTFEVLQGEGKVYGELLGGCFDVFPMFNGTSIWPKKEKWKNKILFLETSEDEVAPEFIEYYLRNLIAQGIIDEINGIIVGKPQNETYYEEYKEIYKRLISKEAGKPDLPILYNFNIGHTAPMCILPLGQKICMDLDNKIVTFITSPVSE